jgi:EmrB/QacA subfamily drug resistance transporter
MTDATRVAAFQAERLDPDASGKVLTVLLTSVAYFMVALDTLVVVTALPSIHRDLGGNVGVLQWTVNAYVLTFGATIITATAIGDLIGRRRMYVLGLTVFTAASAGCALAPNIAALIACRAAEGIGAGIIMPLGLTLLTSAFPAERRGTVVGIWGGVAGLAVACGPLIGGVVTQGLNWHWIFWVNVPIGILAIAGARLRLADSRGPTTRLDLPALALIAAGVGTLTWGLVQVGQAGWGSAQTLGALFLGAGLIAAFLAWERRAAEPMIPLTLFRSAGFSAAVATQFLLAAAIYSAAFLTSQYFQFALGDSPLGTGLRFLPWTATPMVIAPIAGAAFDKIGARPLIVPGLLMQAVGFGWIVYLTTRSAGYASYVAPLVIAGVGISMAIPCVSAAGLNAVSPQSLGKAAGVMNTMQQFGAVFGIAIATTVFNANGSLATAATITSGYRPALGVAAGLSVLGAAAALGIRRAAPVGRVGPGTSRAVEHAEAVPRLPRCRFRPRGRCGPSMQGRGPSPAAGPRTRLRPPRGPSASAGPPSPGARRRPALPVPRNPARRIRGWPR